MGAVPKSRISKGRRNRRRAHDALKAGSDDGRPMTDDGLLGGTCCSKQE
jgi:ribosomal protein L32